MARWRVSSAVVALGPLAPHNAPLPAPLPAVPSTTDAGSGQRATVGKSFGLDALHTRPRRSLLETNWGPHARWHLAGSEGGPTHGGRNGATTAAAKANGAAGDRSAARAPLPSPRREMSGAPRGPQRDQDVDRGWRHRARARPPPVSRTQNSPHLDGPAAAEHCVANVPSLRERPTPSHECLALAQRAMAPDSAADATPRQVALGASPRLGALGRA